MRIYATLLLVFSCSVQLQAQGLPTAHLELEGASGSPGTSVLTRVYLSHDLDCEAFSLGLSHDPDSLAILDLQRGAFLESANPGGVTPDYFMFDSNPASGVGFIVGCVFGLTPPIDDLLAGVDHEILLISYSILPSAPLGETALLFVDDLHIPPVALLVVMNGLEIVPTLQNGVVSVFADCNLNGIPDLDDIVNGTSSDCDGDLVPDECGFAPGQPDCNGDGVPDVCETDCNADGISDLCQPDLDCDGNGVPDSCDLSAGVVDCDGDEILDICELTSGSGFDCNANGVLDNCDLSSGISDDCNGNAIPDACDLTSGIAVDCDSNEIPDSCDIASGAIDCDLDGLIDSCAIAESAVEDCDVNGIPDSCDFATGGDQDGDGVLDVCEDDPFLRGDCNASGVFNIADAIIVLNFLFGYSTGVGCPDACDGNDDEIVNIADAVFILTSLFAGGSLPSSPFPLCGDDPQGDFLDCPSYRAPCP